MKLIVDIGNSFTKIAVFKDNDIIDFKTIEKIDVPAIENVVLQYPELDSSILSSVGNYDSSINKYLKQLGFFIELDKNTPVPFKNCYSTPDTLGKDRIAIAAAAAYQHTGENLLIIDTGTCVTYDLITAEREYMGGSISPGIRMRFNALHNFTHGLPLVHVPNPETNVKLIGDSTESSILSGVVNGLLAEVENTINQYNKLFSPLKIIISGGDYKYFDKLLKSNIFATPNIVVKGLKNILDFNEKN